MGYRDNEADVLLAWRRRQLAQQPGLDATNIELLDRRFGNDFIWPLAAPDNFSRLRVEHEELRIRLANIDDGDQASIHRFHPLPRPRYRETTATLHGERLQTRWCRICSGHTVSKRIVLISCNTLARPKIHLLPRRPTLNRPLHVLPRPDIPHVTNSVRSLSC